MTRDQIEWARRHDWFMDEGPDYVLVKDWATAEIFEGEIVFNDVFCFRDFQELREWAGY